MKKLVFLAVIVSSSLVPLRALSRTLTVAVIDTGIDRDSNSKLCKFGHKSFTQDKDPLKDAHGHGTHVAGIIAKEAGNLDYCLVAVKFYEDSNIGSQNLTNTINAINYAIDIKVDYINYSGGGPIFNEEEFLALKGALDKGIKVVAAAGNEGEDLDKECNYYPACYDRRITVVGNLRDAAFFSTFKLTRNPSSNYGNIVTRWEIGTNIESNLPGGKTGSMSGTSQATGVATGKLIKERLMHE